MSETPRSESHVLWDDSIPQASLESILCTEKLQSRPSRPPDYQKENHALGMLGTALADSPATIFQTLAETILDIAQCDSAGLSLLTKDGKTPDADGKRFYWPAIAGLWNPHVGGGTPRNFGPCGDVLDQNRALLFTHFERRYPYLMPVSPAAEECLLVPFYVSGRAVGTIWGIMHSDRRKFDAEDDRVMASLGKFASSAYQAWMHIEDFKIQVAEREKAEAELRELSNGLEEQVRARTAELERSEERLRLAQQAARIGTFDWNLQTGVNAWTPELEALYGVPPGSFGGTNAAFENLVHPEDRAKLDAQRHSTLTTGQLMSGEWRTIWPDGSVHWIAGRWQALMDENGRPSRMIGINLDITERKHAEERLREYERAVEGAEDMLAVVNREYRFILANRQYLRMENMERAQVIGHLIPEVLNEEVFETVVKPKLDECFEGKVVRYEMRHSYPTVGERDLSLSYFPIESPNGTIDRVACILRDITERKQAEDALRASEERLRLATQAGRMYAYDWDVATNQVLRSPEHAKILGLSEPLRLSQQQFADRIHPDDREKFFDAIRELTPENPMGEVTYRARASDGTLIWLKSNGRGVFDAQGRLLRVIGMVADVTNVKRAEETLADMTRKLVHAQEQERARIGRELHDDISQRLAMVSVGLDQLQQSPAEGQSRVQELSNELRQISDDVQAISHDLHSSQLEYLGVVAGMKSWCKEFGERRVIQVDYRHDVRSNLPSEIGLCLFRVLQEALQNAAKHSGAKRIEVQLQEDGGEIHLAVRDSGRGFDVEAAKQRKGLGLTSMRERLRLVNGTIVIESHPGGGTTVCARVPFGLDGEAMLAAG